jgi:hypothetical protein
LWKALKEYAEPAVAVAETVAHAGLCCVEGVLGVQVGEGGVEPFFEFVTHLWEMVLIWKVV